MKLKPHTLQRLASWRVKGGALYSAIFISIIIMVFLSLMILLSYQNSRTTLQVLQTSQLHCNLNSAFEIAQSAYFTDNLNHHWIKNTFNDDSIRVRRSSWGAYWLICAETKNRHEGLTQSGIYGVGITADTALMLVDNSRPLGLSGRVVFKANCYLSTAGIRPAYIEGLSYSGNAQNNTFIRKALASIPELNATLVKGMKAQQSLSPVTDSLSAGLPEQFNQSFSKKTVVVECNGSYLTKKNWRNNLKLVSASALVIDSTCHLDNVVIVAPKVKFLKGFKGRVHVIVSDSITVEEKCTFLYPSSFVLLNDNLHGEGVKTIYFKNDCLFFGGIIAWRSGNMGNNSTRVFIKLDGTSQYNGFVYSSDYLHLEGEVNATVIASTLLLRTPSAVYENHLINCELNPKKWSQILAIPPAFKQLTKLTCCQKVNT